MMLPSCWETVGHHRGLPQLLTLPLHTSSCHLVLYLGWG